MLRFIPTYTYTSNMFNDALNTPQLYRPATHMLDASVHYISPTGKYDLALRRHQPDRRSLHHGRVAQ
jgi:hypothetical protein